MLKWDEESSPPAVPERTGKNSNGYFGETIDIRAVLSDCVAAAQQHGWGCEIIHAAPGMSFPALRRAGSDRALRAYISTGIHGDEPAGPLAMLRLLRDDAWPQGIQLWLCPCLNPAGYARNSRTNAEGFDLNRQYLTPRARETIAHIEWLERQPTFDLTLCLHEDWESHGFYVYELNPDNRPSLAGVIVKAAGEVCPLDRSEVIEGRPARGGIIRPNLDPRSRSEWPEAFYLLMNKTRLSYTLEAPSDFDLGVRVAALARGATAALRALAAT